MTEYVCFSKVASMQYVADSPERKQARKGKHERTSIYIVILHVEHSRVVYAFCILFSTLFNKRTLWRDMHVPPSSYPGSSIASRSLKDEKLGRGTQIIATFKTGHQNTCFKYLLVGIVHGP